MPPKLYSIFIALFLTFSLASGQIAPNTWWVNFTDKTGSGYSIDNPEGFLSKKSIERRRKQNIKIDSTDLPVSKVYCDSLIKLGLQIHNVSKWLNGASVISTDTALLDTLDKYMFISNHINSNIQPSSLKKGYNKFGTLDTLDYGESNRQITMLNGDSLHLNGFKGKDILIGIQDAGFSNSETVESLNHIWENNQVLAYRDFVKNGPDIFTAHAHGTTVFSIIAGIIDGKMYGTATEANFVLVRTENASSEYILEEYDWVSGAEYCDSLGVDIVNSSLGYATFDDSQQDHRFQDLDGKTTPISIGATYAARKGMLIVASAGNEGNKAWLHITTPADADSILSIGAVNSNEIIADFSGRGYSYDGRIKPDISAQGVSTITQPYPGSLTTCNGTSCSSPIIAGLAACLWQSRPNVTAQELRSAIIKASNRYQWPDSLYGYGIPNFYTAQKILDSISQPREGLSKIELTPNIINDYAQVTTILPWLSSPTNGIIVVYDVNGRMLQSRTVQFSAGITIIVLDNLQTLELGYYILRIAVGGRFYNTPFIKK